MRWVYLAEYTFSAPLMYASCWSISREGDYHRSLVLIGSPGSLQTCVTLCGIWTATRLAKFYVFGDSWIIMSGCKQISSSGTLRMPVVTHGWFIFYQIWDGVRFRRLFAWNMPSMGFGAAEVRFLPFRMIIIDPWSSYLLWSQLHSRLASAECMAPTPVHN